jgi:hypothetical protein
MRSHYSVFERFTYNVIRFKQRLCARQPIFLVRIKPLLKPKYVKRNVQKRCSVNVPLRRNSHSESGQSAIRREPTISSITLVMLWY